MLIIGQYLKQLRQLAERFDIPLSPARRRTPSARTCTTSSARGEVRQLILSKVGNFAIDLPDANVLIQVSGTFGSRQEEAQRLGRILRPKADGEPAHFYTLVTRDTRELDFAHHRQLFLTEQGYSYTIVDAEQLFPSDVIQRATKPSMNGRANGHQMGASAVPPLAPDASSPRVKRPRSPNGSPTARGTLSEALPISGSARGLRGKMVY